MRLFDTKQAAVDYDVLAPDGSEVRFLATTDKASSVHCTLAPGAVTLAVVHQTVDEIWYFLAGAGEVWRKQGDLESVVKVVPGMSLSLPVGTYFQFRCDEDVTEPLQFLIVTIPAWPGEQETARVPDHWPPTVKST